MILDELSLIERINAPLYLITLIDHQGNIVTWNHGAETLTGYSETEVVGKHFSMFYTDTDKKKRIAESAIQKAYEKGYYESAGWRIKKNRSRFWVSETISLLGDHNGSSSFILISRDLTKVKGIEDLALRWQSMFDNSGWSFAISMAGTNTFEMVNSAFAKMHGYSVNELTGKPITDVLDPEFRNFLTRDLSIIHEKGNYIFETKHVRKDGSTFPVLVDATVIRDSGGKILHRLVNVHDVSDFKEIQQSSLLIEEKFYQLFEQASEGIIIADLKGHYTDVNTSICQMLGYTREELLHKTVADLIPAEDAEQAKEARSFLKKEGQIQIKEWKLLRKDGTFLPVEISAKILPDGRWQAFVRDISQRKKEHEALARSEQKFRGLMEEYHDAIAIVNKHGLIEFVNKQFTTNFGYAPEEIIGKPMEELMPERYRMKHVGHRMKYMAHPVARPMGLGLDLYALRKDGSEFPVDISLAPFETNEGIVFTAFVRDLSDRKRYEAQQKFLAETSIVLSEDLGLDERLAKMAQLFVPFLSDLCLLYLSEQGKFISKAILHRDENIGELLKVVASDLFSKPEISPYKPEGKTGVIEPLLIEEVTDSFLQALACDEKHFNNIKDLKLTSFLLVPLVSREKVVGVLILAMSTSGRKFTVEDTAFIRLAGSRIALSLDNAQLFIEAQKATQAREDILSIVSHDLRNPLAAIKSGFQLIPQLAHENEEEKLDKIISTLTESANFMERLINDLLDFSKIQQGILPLKLQEMHLKKEIDDVVQLFLLKAKEKSIELSAQLPEKDSVLICDPDRIKQVLNNFVGNAIKFTPPEGKILIRAEELEDKFYFSVSDTGPGLAKESLAHIFDRYWQEKKTAHLGTGLGLYIAKGIVEAHGGKIWAESEPGLGCNFQFEIPKNTPAE